MKIIIICVAFERPISMRLLIDSFMVQTNPNWELNIIYDGKAPIDILDIMSLYNDPRVKFFQSDTRNQHFGHPNRRMMLNKLIGDPGDFILMTNDDNYYVPVFVEYFLRECNLDIGMVYCDSVHSHFQYRHHETRIKEHWIDMGSFIVRIDIAKETGFNHDCFTADGLYAVESLETCNKRGLRNIYIPKPLFVHN